MQAARDDVSIDLSETQRVSEKIRAMVLKLRADHDLARFEYTRNVRIAPGEISHSHPILTLNSMVREEHALLSLYLHEQMHWYVTWFSHARGHAWRTVWSSLLTRYPEVPVVFPEGAHDAQSSYLHLMVNWLEIEAASTFLGRERAVEIASKNFVYSGLYRIVLSDWDELASLYRDNGLTPVRSAAVMTQDDLALAARMDEAATDSNSRK